MSKMRRLLEGNPREQPALEAARKETIEMDAILAAIAGEFAEPWDDIRNRRGHPARALAIVLCRRHSSLKLGEIGQRLGGSDYAAVSQAQNRMEKKLLQDRSLAATARRITKRLTMSHVET